MYVSPLPFGRRFGACWECKRCSAARITLRLMVRLSGRIIQSSKWFELWRTRVRIGCNAWRWLNWPFTMLWWSWLVCHLCMLRMDKGYECQLTILMVYIRYRLFKAESKPGRKLVIWFSIIYCWRRHTKRSMLMLDIGTLNMQLGTRSCCWPRTLDCVVLGSFMTIMLVCLLYLNVLVKLYIA